MKKRIVIIAILMGTLIVPARAQLMQMGIKLQYSTSSIDEMMNSVSETYQNFSTDFLKGCEGGLLFRINVGRWMTIQPEANFSISSVWDSVDAQGDFVSSALAAFNNVQTINLSIPVLASLHLVDIEKLVDVRVFAGPEFYTVLKDVSENGVDFSKYSIIVGAGVDLFDILYVDGRMVKNFGGDMAFRLGVGLLF